MTPPYPPSRRNAPATGNNLLVVDWDFFFPNPMFAAAWPGKDSLMYDWRYHEGPGGNSYESPVIWQIRAHNFLSYGFPLPTVRGWEGFWKRFPHLLTAQAPLLYCDSNLLAAPGHTDPPGGGAWDRIDLYDAHHDAGYDERAETDCGNWMVAHRKNGTRDLRVHYPRWRGTVRGTEPDPVIPMRRSLDDGRPVLDVVHTHVLLCRSSPWVPPWCDEQFMELITSYPEEYLPHNPEALPVRTPLDMDAVRQMGEASRLAMERFNQPGDPDGITRADREARRDLGVAGGA